MNILSIVKSYDEKEQEPDFVYTFAGVTLGVDIGKFKKNEKVSYVIFDFTKNSIEILDRPTNRYYEKINALGTVGKFYYVICWNTPDGRELFCNEYQRLINMPIVHKE